MQNANEHASILTSYKVIPMIFYGLINATALLLEKLHLLPQEKAAM